MCFFGLAFVSGRDFGKRIVGSGLLVAMKCWMKASFAAASAASAAAASGRGRRWMTSEDFWPGICKDAEKDGSAILERGSEA